MGTWGSCSARSSAASAFLCKHMNMCRGRWAGVGSKQCACRGVQGLCKRDAKALVSTSALAHGMRWHAGVAATGRPPRAAAAAAPAAWPAGQLHMRKPLHSPHAPRHSEPHCQTPRADPRPAGRASAGGRGTGHAGRSAGMLRGAGALHSACKRAEAGQCRTTHHSKERHQRHRCFHCHVALGQRLTGSIAWRVGQAQRAASVQTQRSAAQLARAAAGAQAVPARPRKRPSMQGSLDRHRWPAALSSCHSWHGGVMPGRRATALMRRQSAFIARASAGGTRKQAGTLHDAQTLRHPMHYPGGMQGHAGTLCTICCPPRSSGTLSCS